MLGAAWLEAMLSILQESVNLHIALHTNHNTPKERVKFRCAPKIEDRDSFPEIHRKFCYGTQITGIYLISSVLYMIYKLVVHLRDSFRMETGTLCLAFQFSIPSKCDRNRRTNRHSPTFYELRTSQIKL